MDRVIEETFVGSFTQLNRRSHTFSLSKHMCSIEPFYIFVLYYGFFYGFLPIEG